MIRMVLVLAKPTVVLGLSPVNIERLIEGQPIRVNLQHLDPDGGETDLPDIDVMIGATNTDDWRAFMARLVPPSEEGRGHAVTNADGSRSWVAGRRPQQPARRDPADPLPDPWDDQDEMP